MAYTIVKSDGTVLTTIPDGTINTTVTSIGLPGRNYAGYGQTLDTNFVHTLENFAASTPPAHPLRGQLWFNTTNATLNVCPTDGETNASAWSSLALASSGGTTTFGQITVTGDANANNVTATYTVSANSVTASHLTISTDASVANATLSGTTTISNVVTTSISSGSQSTPGNIIGAWTANGNATIGDRAGTSLLVTGGNLVVANTYSRGIVADNFYYSNGDAIVFSGSYGNANVAAYLPTYGGNVLTVKTTASTLTTGASSTAGNITGNWSLTAGSRLNATYADLAERFHADDVYDAGTVVQIGGTNEITAVQYELSDDIFGVISSTAAYLMNAAAGDDLTHPPVAVTGRVPVKVVGIINKGDRLVSAGNGLARAAHSGEATAFNTIGRALETKSTSEEGTIEAIVMIR